MKIKFLLSVILAICLFSCDDNTGTLGINMFPGNDQNINGQLKRFQIETYSVAMDKIYARTGIGYVGRFTDPDFGPYKAGFLTQFNCPEGFEFPKVCDKNNPEDLKDENAIMVKDEIYRTELVLRYQEYFGDSLTPSHLTVYRLNKRLDSESAKYTDIDPKLYYDPTDPNARIGSKTYTAVDYSVSDSVRNLSTYAPSVAFTLPTEIGQELLEKSRELGKDNFYKEFKDLFKGIYVECDGAESNILYIDQVELRVIFECYFRDSETGEILKKKVKEEGETEYADSTGYRYKLFAATREIIQANSFQTDPSVIAAKVNEPEKTYLKTPAGIYTQAILPIEEMAEELTADTLNVAQVVFSAFNESTDHTDFNFPMSAPGYILLVREKERNAFFEQNKKPDNATSYLATLSKNQYTFSDLSQLLNTCMLELKEAEEELQKGPITVKTEEGEKTVSTLEEWKTATLWNKIALIPVSVTSENNTVTAVDMDLKPGCAKLQGGHKADGSPIYIDMEVVYTSFQ